MDITRKEEVLEKGYIITNEWFPKVFGNEDTDENYQNPGIKMFVEECNNIDSLMKIFKESHYDDVPDNWYDILFDKLPDWKLCTVTVNALHVIFDFVNPELNNRRTELEKAGKEDDVIAMPASNGFAMLAIDECPLWPGMKLRFETTLPTGGISNTIVDIRNGKCNVIKHLPFGYRVYEVIGEGDFQGVQDEGIKVILTEYLW